MKETIKLGLILCFITLIAGLILGFVNAMTEPIIQERRLGETYEVIEKFFPETQDVLVNDDLDIDINISDLEENNIINIYASLDGDIIGYLIHSSASGYGGAVEVLTGISLEGEVVGIDILTHTETSGLGDRIEEESYKDQYKGIDATNSLDKDQIDNISGATVSARAVEQSVDRAIEFFIKHLKK